MSRASPQAVADADGLAAWGASRALLAASSAGTIETWAPGGEADAADEGPVRATAPVSARLTCLCVHAPRGDAAASVAGDASAAGDEDASAAGDEDAAEDAPADSEDEAPPPAPSPAPPPEPAAVARPGDRVAPPRIKQKLKEKRKKRRRKMDK